jgi:hypothetical protein
LEDARSAGASEADIDLLRAYENEVSKLAAHDTEFAFAYPDHEIIGQQGCGDLTMNLWNVAYLNSPFALAEGGAELIHLHEEPISERTYSCLVKWLPERGPARMPYSELSIEDVRFNAHASDKNSMAFTFTGADWAARGDAIDFAVYGQQIVRAGEPTGVSRIAHEFSDLRHIVQMPNLNPRDPFDGETSGYPRSYFASKQYADVWFGEAQLIDDRNYQRLACLGPIFLSRLYRGLSVPVDQLRGAMARANYTEVTAPRKDLDEGEYRFVPEDDTLVEIHFKRNTYGWSMLGLNQARDKLIALACAGRPGGIAGKDGYTLAQAADKLIEAGAHDGLLIDEGADVFQLAALDPGPATPALAEMVPLLRNRLRATFIFARPKSPTPAGSGSARTPR